MSAGSRSPAAALLCPLLVCLQACHVDADFSDAAPTPVTLVAEEYRGEITSIDRLVFRGTRLQAERGKQLASQLERLAERVRKASPAPFLRIESLELRRLASLVRHLPPHAPPEPIRRDWMRIRSNVFDDREWFARSGADLEPEPELSPTAISISR